jgi:hypothetical protein
MSVIYSGDGITFGDGSVTTSGWTGFKNRIINGAMTFAQRATSNSSVGTSSYTTLDRWALDTRINASPTGSYTFAQSTDAPAGFLNSASITVTTAGNSLASGYALQLCHFIEGNNIADLAWGTASAKTVTLSFWVKSSITGTWAVGILNAGYDRSYVATYTINSANTWEYKTITIPGCPSGSWNTTIGRGIQIKFSLGSGTNYQTASPNTWLSGAEYEDVATKPFWNTTGATFLITGVQFEVGSAASSFEYRPYGVELHLCERYYQVLPPMNQHCGYNVQSGQYVDVRTPFRTAMRDAANGTVVLATTYPNGVHYYGTSLSGSASNITRVSASISDNSDGGTYVGLKKYNTAWLQTRYSITDTSAREIINYNVIVDNEI